MPTALVTGASAGLGVEFARQLAARGYDLVLVARRRERLEELAAELPREPVVIDHDLAADAAGLPAKVEAAGATVDLLVNNAGFGTYGRVWEIEPGRDAEMVRLNCEAVVILTRAFLPAMIERGSGGVIVVASTAGMQPIPWEATYAATKAFALSFTEGLSEELRGTGVAATAVNPGPVPTEWQRVAGVDDIGKVPGTIPADRCVAEALAAWEAGRRSIIPGRLMRWVMRGSRIGPRGLRLRVTERLYRPGP
jgi:uncharacterized protein